MMGSAVNKYVQWVRKVATPADQICLLLVYNTTFYFS
jgi:hypothetical protein